MIRRIRVKNYKSLRDNDLELKQLSVLFGPNGAGKSNFIDALQLLSRLTTSRSLKEAFDPPYRGKPMESFSFGGDGLEGLMTRPALSFLFEVDIQLSKSTVDGVNREIREAKRGQENADGDGLSQAQKHTSYIHHPLLRYRLEIGMTPQSGILHVEDEYLAALGRDGKPKKERPKPFIERVNEKIHLRMEGQSHPTYFDRRLDHTIISRPHYPPHYPHLTALKREFESWFFYYFEPRERMRTATSVKEVRHIGLMGEELAAFLNTLYSLDPRQFKAIERAVHSVIPTITGIKTEVNKFGEVELSLKEGETAMPARVVSEGTLRVLGLLALGGVKDVPAVIGFEEPENGVHPRRIRDIAKILVNRSEHTQLIVTTHSPVLPDHVPESSLLVCRKVDGRTEIKPIELWGSLQRQAAVDAALNEGEIEALPVSERLLRGDFDA